MKKLGLVVVAAMAVMAFVGASSASAESQLCKVQEQPCSSANHYGSGTAVTATLKSGTSAVLQSDLGNVVCTSSTVGGTITSQDGHGSLTQFDFTGCKLGNTSCTVSAVHLPFQIQVTWTSGYNGAMTASNSGAGEPGAHVTCSFFLNCTFTAEPTVTVQGGSMAVVDAEGVELNKESGGFTCPSEAFWDAEYQVTAPEPLYVSHS